jgi:succinate dehydrogenase/fumarate reductase-like Fe-S protein
MPTFTMRLFRGDATSGGFKDYQVDSDEGMVILDVVHRVQATLANDLRAGGTARPVSAGRAAPR